MKLLKNKKNMLIILGVIVLIIVVSAISYTYAYFAFSGSDTNTITGDSGKAELELDVEKIISTDESLRLVPLLDEAIGNAVAGTGGKSSCIDANGNLSCQVYKITLKNIGTVNLVVKGSIELQAQGGNNIFKNAKWQQLSNLTTIKSGTVINSMERATLEDNVSIKADETKTFYFTLWISEINADQTEDDYGNLNGTVYFEDAEGLGATATFRS